MLKQKNLKINHNGFTLIEIVAILIILGILSATVIPKYIDLQEQARYKSARSAVSEVESRLSMGYGQYLIQNRGSLPEDIASICTMVNDSNVLPTSLPGNVNVGNDYVVELSQVAGGKTAKIKVTTVQGTVLTNAVVLMWKIPD